MRRSATTSKRGGRALEAVALVACAAAFIVAGGACGAANDAGPAALDGAVIEAAAPVHGITACGRCESEACARERRGCAAEASCTKYLSCAESCGSIEGGKIDPACEATCPRPSDPAGSAAFAALARCRALGPGAECEACGGGLGRSRSGLLHQVCRPPPSPLPEPHICDPEGDGGPELLALLKTCAKCQFERCCETRAACTSSEACGALRGCFRVCPDLDTAGVDKCHTDFAAGLPEFARASACISLRCQSECGNPTPCGVCSATRCAEENAALNGTPDGYLFSTCVQRCTSKDTKIATACVLACFDRFPSAVPAALVVDRCDAKNCADACRTAE